MPTTTRLHEILASMGERAGTHRDALVSLYTERDDVDTVAEPEAAYWPDAAWNR